MTNYDYRQDYEVIKKRFAHITGNFTFPDGSEVEAMDWRNAIVKLVNETDNFGRYEVHVYFNPIGGRTRCKIYDITVSRSLKDLTSAICKGREYVHVEVNCDATGINGITVNYEELPDVL